MEHINYSQEPLHQLVEQAKQGDEQARNQVISSFDREVQTLVIGMHLPVFLNEGAAQEARRGIHEAIGSFEEDKGGLGPWVMMHAEWSVIEFIGQEFGLNTYQQRLYKPVREVNRRLQQQLEVENPPVDALIEAYSRTHGVRLRVQTVTAILYPPRVNRDEMQSEDIESVEVPAGYDGSPDNIEQAGLEDRLRREGEKAASYALVYEALGPREAPNFVVLLTLQVRCGLNWVEIHDLAKSPSFSVEGFRSWEAVHLRFRLPAWVPAKWEEARKALFVRGGLVPKDPSTYGKRFTEAGGRIERYLKEQ